MIWPRLAQGGAFLICVTELGAARAKHLIQMKRSEPSINAHNGRFGSCFLSSTTLCEERGLDFQAKPPQIIAEVFYSACKVGRRYAYQFCVLYQSSTSFLT